MLLRQHGQLQYPTSIAYEKLSGQLAVVDSLNGRVQFYDLNGLFLRSIGSIGTGPLKFMHPQGLAFEYGAASSVRMYVSDAMVKKVQAVDPAGSGTFLSYIGGPKDGHVLPSELAFDQAAHRLYMVNGLGGVSFYQILDGSVVVNSVTPNNATIIASAAKAAGTIATVASVSTVSPLTLSTVADGSTVTTDVLDISGLATGAVSVTVNGLPVAVANGLFSTAIPLSVGANEITVLVTDTAGASWKEVRTVTRDAAAPLLTIAAADVQSTAKALLTLKGSTDRGAYVAVAGVPADLNKLEWSSTVSLAPGLNTVEIQAVDLNGQASSQKRTIFFRAAAPELAITSPPEDIITAEKSLTLTGFVSVGDKVTVSAEINGNVKPVTVDAGRLTLPVKFQQEGAYTVTLTAVAAGGEVSTVCRSIIYRKAQ